MNKVFIDCNIIIDWIFDRLPFSVYASVLISLIEKKEINAYISPIVLANTYYIIKKEKSKKVAEAFLQDCNKIFNILDITGTVTSEAINNRYRDFEDDLHYFTALKNKMTYIITRDKNDYKDDRIGIKTAEEYLIELGKI